MASLKAELSAKALIRRAQAGGAMAMVARKGDPDAGLVYVKVSLLDGRARLFAPTRGADGERAYREASKGTAEPDHEIEAKLAREAEFDPDIWVIEVEDRQGRAFIVDPLVD